MKRSKVLVFSSEDGKRHIYVDAEIAEDLLKYINRDKRHKKKFNYIRDFIIRNTRYPELYDKEEIDKSCKGVTAMKLFKGQENDRIYCKEFHNTRIGFVVVCGKLHELKKSEKLSEKEKNLIRTVASYEYEF